MSVNEQQTIVQYEQSPQTVLRRKSFGVALLVVAALCIPFVVTSYQTFQLTLALTYAIAILGLNLVMGYNGQISIGHGAFFAVGGYTAAILMDRFDIPYWCTLPVAGVLGFVSGFLFGLPALRLEGFYLALATFSLAIATPQILKNSSVEPLTNGVQGIVLIKPESPVAFLNSDQWLYLLCLAVAALLFLVARNLVRGRIGRALIAIRDNPLAAEAMGIDTAFYKTTTFGISAAYTSVAGALAAIVIQYVSPDSYGPFLSISLKVGVIVGGLSSIVGALYGAVFVQFVPNLAGEISKAAPWAVYGVCLIAVIYTMPGGAAGLVKKTFDRFVKAKRRRKECDS